MRNNSLNGSLFPETLIAGEMLQAYMQIEIQTGKHRGYPASIFGFHVLIIMLF